MYPRALVYARRDKDAPFCSSVVNSSKNVSRNVAIILCNNSTTAMDLWCTDLCNIETSEEKEE